MARPQVSISKIVAPLSNALNTEDGVVLLIVDDPAIAEPKSFLSLEQAEEDGITLAADTAGNKLTWHLIRDFYLEAGEGAELHILPYDFAAVGFAVADIFTDGQAENTALREYLASLNGRIKIIGLADQGLIASTVNLTALVLAAHTFAEAEFTRLRPVHIIVSPSQYLNIGINTAVDLRAQSAGTVSVLVARDANTRIALENAGNTSYVHYTGIGLLLGRLSKIHVGRNIGRVRDGAVAGVLSAEFNAGTDNSGELAGQIRPYIEANETVLNALADKGYIYFDRYPGKVGWYFSDDPTCTQSNQSDAYISFNRAVNKAGQIVVTTYIEFLKDEVQVDPDTGRLAPIVVQSFQNALQTAIEDTMISNPDPDRPQEISGARVFIDPAQNVLATSKIVAQLTIVPLGTAREISTTIQLVNPAN